jgi:hypothetical protein
MTRAIQQVIATAPNVDAETQKSIGQGRAL